MVSKLPKKQGLYDPKFEHDACGIGFVVNVKGKKSHEIISQALTILKNLAHRGGCGAEENTGDGAGILMQMPHEFFELKCSDINIEIPSEGEYGTGMVFLPQNKDSQSLCEQVFESIVREEGQEFLGWRIVPVDSSSLGSAAKASMPIIKQAFVKKNTNIKNVLDFERKLYVIRRRSEKAIKKLAGANSKGFYIASLSCRTIVYKGMLTAGQLDKFYPDLSDSLMASALALVHSRYSTNTFPSWERAHPNRYLVHNGEINTLMGNINWMNARQAVIDTNLFGEDISNIFPIIDSDGSDSSMFDNCVEFLTLSGRPLPHVMMMMIPEPWSNHESMNNEKKAFYEYHSCLMEPWDGPAAMGFTDGSIIGALLDRNGLRPSRYYVTDDDLVIMASEVGVLDVPPEKVISKERLHPGKMLLIDTVEGRIIDDDEIKMKYATAHPYRKWLDENMINVSDLQDVKLTREIKLLGEIKDIKNKEQVNVVNKANEIVEISEKDAINFNCKSCENNLLQLQKAFGYTYEELRLIIKPMAENGIEAIGAMGTDIPLAVLSNKPQLLYNYFKQLFAQVTNPPIDAIREEIITAAETMIGSEGNIIAPKPESCRMIKLKHPILESSDFLKVSNINIDGFKAVTLPILFNASEEKGLEKAVDKLCKSADEAVEDGANILVLSDRGISKNQAAIPALLAVAGLHHHLIKKGTRTKVSLILESGEPREVHHFALLIGYGVSAIYPYLAMETIGQMIDEGLIKDEDKKLSIKKYVKAIMKGVIKILSKMGISTVQSYRGAQIFEAVGLNHSVIDKYFTGTVSRVGGVGIDEIAMETLERHNAAFVPSIEGVNALESGGQYQWRKDGEYHLYNPETIHKLQMACRKNDYSIFKEYSELINDQSQRTCTIRGLMKFKENRQPIPLDEVESIDSICKRFKTGAMSYGSISKEAHEALAIAMNRIGGKSNTGEGGEDPERFKRDINGDSRCSAIKQVASGRFGVTSNYLVNAQEIQIKMAQGAKPGEGGQLPGKKVYPWIAKVRHSTPGVELISPPPHHDIYSIEDLAELIHDLKNANSNARISVKLVSEAGVGTIAAGVAKGRADVVLISGYDGGTGASPRTSIRHAGLPWELGLVETHQTLLLNNLRSRIVVETDGKLMTGRDVAIAALLGAEEYGFATAPLVVLGCVMMRICNLDTCPVGVATQNPELRKRFSGDPSHVANFMQFIASELREIMAQLGFRTVNEMIGRTDVLEMNDAISHWKTKGIDLSAILYRPDVPESVGRYCQIEQDHELEKALDNKVILSLCKPALENGEKVTANLEIKNTDRVVGTILGSELTKRYGEEGLPEDTITLNFKGSAGQSFGAFIPKGITLKLEGDSNDYIGKGLSGGKIIVKVPQNAKYLSQENIIIGNVAFYGATQGEAYINGVAGERFCVRNSGVNAVVEGTGDHGCEYMTGGKVVVLGPTGRNFAAGMSGGIAYVLDVDGAFSLRCNKGMVELEKLDENDISTVKEMVEKHVMYTGSKYAEDILNNWDEMVCRFVKVMPKDYKRMLFAIKKMKDKGYRGEQLLLNAFEESNKLIEGVF